MLEVLNGFLDRLFKDDPDALCVDFESYERSLQVLNGSLDRIEIVIDGSEEERADGTVCSEDTTREHMHAIKENKENDENEEVPNDILQPRAGERTHENTESIGKPKNENREPRAIQENTESNEKSKNEKREPRAIQKNTESSEKQKSEKREPRAIQENTESNEKQKNEKREDSEKQNGRMRAGREMQKNGGMRDGERTHAIAESIETGDELRRNGGGKEKVEMKCGQVTGCGSFDVKGGGQMVGVMSGLNGADKDEGDAECTDSGIVFDGIDAEAIGSLTALELSAAGLNSLVCAVAGNEEEIDVDVSNENREMKETEDRAKENADGNEQNANKEIQRMRAAGLNSLMIVTAGSEEKMDVSNENREIKETEDRAKENADGNEQNANKEIQRMSAAGLNSLMIVNAGNEEKIDVSNENREIKETEDRAKENADRNEQNANKEIQRMSAAGLNSLMIVNAENEEMMIMIDVINENKETKSIENKEKGIIVEDKEKMMEITDTRGDNKLFIADHFRSWCFPYDPGGDFFCTV
jgi:protein-disulfide isomerase-like protein with CxxC motif